MDKFSEIIKIDTNSVPSNFGDIPILLNKESVSYFSNYDGNRPIWIKDIYGEVYEMTNLQIKAKGIICTENGNTIYHKYEEDDIKSLLSAYIIYIESDASVCSSCGHINLFFDADSSTWRCLSCGKINQSWKYTENKSNVPSSATIIYETPFKELNYINTEFLPDYIYKDKMYINKNNISEIEFYSYGENVDNVINPLIIFKNLKGFVYSFYPSQINARSQIIMKDKGRVFTQYTKSQLDWVLNSAYTIEYLRFGRLINDIGFVNEIKMKNIDASLKLLDSSLMKIDASLLIFDSSYGEMRKKLAHLDSSYNKLDSSFKLFDSSLMKIDASLLIFDSSFKTFDSSLKKFDSCLFVLDSSLRKIDTSVRIIDGTVMLIDSSVYNSEMEYYNQSLDPAYH